MKRLLFSIGALMLLALPVDAQPGTDVKAVSTGFIDDCDSAAYRIKNQAECAERRQNTRTSPGY